MPRRHGKLALVCCAIGLAGAGIHYAITPKSYQATTTMQIERRNLTPLSNAQDPWLENDWNMVFYPTQYELLQSRGLAERVVKSLDLMEDPSFNPGAAKEGAHGANAEGDDAVLGSLADQIRGGLAVEPVRSTQLVQLSFRAASPEFAAKAANAFAEAYIDMGVEDRFATAGKASSRALACFSLVGPLGLVRRWRPQGRRNKWVWRWWFSTVTVLGPPNHRCALSRGRSG